MIASFSIGGKVALVAENDPMHNILVEDMLLDEGCSVRGPHLRFNAAIEAAKTENLDIGILNATIEGTKVYPIGNVPWSRDIPYIITSSNPEAVALERPECVVLAKPFRADDLLRAIEEAFSRKSKRKLAKSG